jgi:Flp pilus assembly pilin Flp
MRREMEGRGRDRMRKLLRPLRNKSGQSMTEYLLILAIVLMAALQFKKVFGSKINAAVESVGSQIDTAVQQ